MAFTEHQLELEKRKVLEGLVDFYYEKGHESETYADPEKGGILENKLADRLGYQVPAQEAPPAFRTAVRQLAEEQLVRRMDRGSGPGNMGVWPTAQGLARVKEWRMTQKEKLLAWAAKHAGALAAGALAGALSGSMSGLIGRWIGRG